MLKIVCCWLLLTSYVQSGVESEVDDVEKHENDSCQSYQSLKR